jgi:hypothetical protein
MQPRFTIPSSIKNSNNMSFQGLHLENQLRQKMIENSGKQEDYQNLVDN